MAEKTAGGALAKWPTGVEEKNAAGLPLDDGGNPAGGTPDATAAIIAGLQQQNETIMRLLTMRGTGAAEGIRAGDGAFALPGEATHRRRGRHRGAMQAARRRAAAASDLAEVTTAPGAAQCGASSPSAGDTGGDGVRPGEATHRRRGRHRGAMQAARQRAAAASDLTEITTAPDAAQCGAASPSAGGDGGQTRGAALHGAREQELMELPFQSGGGSAKGSGIVLEPTSEKFKVDTVESWFRTSVMMDRNSFWR
jgi:hypothetical protein